jgi:hypothetical protein
MAWLRTRETRSAWLIFWVFVILPTVGTLSHEAGHIAVARWLGYETRLHYASMSVFTDPGAVYAGRCGLPPAGEADLAAYAECRGQEEHRESLLISLGGPLQTMLTGTIGLVWLLWDRRKRADKPLGRAGWCAVLLSVLWSRQVFNQLRYGLDWMQGEIDVPTGGDEEWISHLLGIPHWSMLAASGLIGLIVCSVVVGYGVPAPQRRPLLIGGIAGAVAGYVLWMGLIGPYLLP